MDYLLPAAFLIGLLLFILSWLRVVFAGFGHHFVTGLVAVIPVLNLLILPGIWHKVYGWVLVGSTGLLVAVGTWFFGADQHLYRYASEAGLAIEVSAPAAAEGSLRTEGLNLQKTTETAAATDGSDTDKKPEPASSVELGQELPKIALYKVRYKAVATDTLLRYQGHYVRLTRNDRKTFEGKLISTSSNRIVIERRLHGGTLEQPFALDVITKAEVIDKQ